MKKLIKFSIILAILVLIAGGALLGYAVATKAFQTEVSTNKYVITEEFENINFDLTTSNIFLKKSNDEELKIETVESKYTKIEYEVKDNTLNVKNNEGFKNWIDRIFDFSFVSTSVTLYLPNTDYNEITAKVSTGDITVPNDFTFNKSTIISTTGDVEFKANTLTDITIEVTTGEINVEKSNCENLKISGSTGDVFLKELEASNSINVSLSTGDIKFEKIDSHSIKLATTTGDIEGTFLTNKRIEASTTTGDTDVESTADADLCIASTTTGDINIKIVK